MRLSPRRIWSTPAVRLGSLGILFVGTALVTACPDGDDESRQAGCTCYSEMATGRVEVSSATSLEACLQAQESNTDYFECEWNDNPVTPTPGARPGLLSPE